MAIHSLLVVQYLLVDLFISIFAIGLYSPNWNFQSSLIHKYIIEDGYAFSTNPKDFVILSLLRVLLILSAVVLGLFRKSNLLEKASSSILVLAVLSYSYSLSKILGFSENEITVTYPGVWISIGWSIFSSLLFFLCWKHILNNVSKTNYETLDEEDEDGENQQEDAMISSTTSSSSQSTAKEEEIKLSRSKVIGMLLSFCKEQWFWFGTGFIFLGLYAVARIFIPSFTGQVIDDIVKSRSTDVLMKSVLILGTLTTLSAIFGGLRAGCLEFATGKLFKQIRSRLFNALVHQEVAFYDINKSGEIVSRLTSDCEKITDCIALNLNFFLRNVVMFIGSLIFMFTMSWRLAVVNFVVIPPVGFMLHWFGAYFDSISEHVQDTISKANQVAEEVISSIRTVRSFACENRESARFDRQLDITLIAFMKKAYALVGYVGCSEIWQNAVLVTVLFYGGHLVNSGKMRGDQLITFMLYQMQLSENVDNIFYEFTGLMEAVGASRKVFAYILREPRIAPNGSKRPEVQGKLEFSNVHFTYPSRPNHPILKGLNLTIDAGQTMALVGPSGGGKSSIVSLIQHFYEPSEGTITLDGTPISSVSHDFYHERVALVAQEPILYCGTIRYNILYGCDWATEEDMLNAARMANVHDFVSQLDDGYDTECGEKGVQMSGGQKQRIAIARALVRRPSVLILDEATSALDAESEALVQEALSRCAKERTVLIIAHRLSTIEKADRIAFIQKGAVMQLGTHSELMSDHDGLYYSLVSKQLSLT